MPNPYDKINSRFERELQRALHLSLLQVRGLYEDAILELSFYAATIKAKEKPFALSLYPALNEQVEGKLRRMHRSLLRLITANQKAAWQLSNLKNTEIVDRRLAGKKPAGRVRQVLYDPNAQALEAFLSRKENGLNLSDRVWNLLDPFKHELEQGLGLGISEGRPARKMATDMKRYLNQPDKLFRRVKKDGKLRLSKAAREYKPGQGVYRSSFRNALRLTRTEVNMSYRRADVERWGRLPFVTGYKIVLSNTHEVYDICDELNKSIYPKDFVWAGWHPNCKCHMIPVLASDKDYNRLEDYLLGLEDSPPDIPMTSETPKAFNDWVGKNRDRINGWANRPYWARDNGKYVKDLLKKK